MSKSILVLLSFWVLGCHCCFAQCNNIVIAETDSLIIYHPQFSDIDLRFSSEIPYGEEVLYCCAGAFTAKCLTDFSHDNIRCPHVSRGERFEGSPEPVCNGVFTFFNGQGHFAYSDSPLIDSAAQNGGMGFCQVLILLNDSIIYTDTVAKTFWMKQSYVFRALCEKDGKLCIIQSKEKVDYAVFVRLLSEYEVKNAIYLDMGGWGYAHYCDNDNMMVETTHAPTKYASNWLVFLK
ncbi:MAG: hypothetical protein MJZ76_04220 [Bacteroidales bacterium]|nr:hypothetical protein [Bacteroidales bacterium]